MFIFLVLAVVLATMAIGYALGRTDRSQQVAEQACCGQSGTGATAGELRKLLAEGVIEERHVRDWVEAKILTERAQQVSMLTQARVAAMDGMVSLDDLEARQALTNPLETPTASGTFMRPMAGPVVVGDVVQQDCAALDEALSQLTLEQRIAVKASLLKSGLLV